MKAALPSFIINALFTTAAIVLAHSQARTRRRSSAGIVRVTSSNFPKATRSNSNSLTSLARRINLEKNLAGLDDASSNIADNPGYCTRKSADSTRKTAIISSNPTTAIFGDDGDW